jgi:hypothetical protein
LLNVGDLSLQMEKLSLVGVDSMLWSALIGQRAKEVCTPRNQIGALALKVLDVSHQCM